MEQIIEFLKECKTFYLATTENDQPRVRPFGAIMEFEGMLYICTNNTKNVYKQMLANPLVEISAAASDGRYIRLEGRVEPDHRTAARAAMLQACPSLNKMYQPEDGIFEVLKFTKGKAVLYSFGTDPVEFTL